MIGPGDAAAIIVSAMNFMVPILLATIGEILTEKSGVVNIGVEGILNLAAFTAAAVAFTTGDPAQALLAGAAAGALLGLAHGVLSTYLRADQIITGIGVNMLAYGLTVAGLITLWHQHGASPPVPKLPTISLGEGLALTPLAPASIAAAAAVWLLLAKTSWGLRLRACGEDPHAAEAMGVDVHRTRTLATTLGGLLAGLGGAALSIAIIGQYVRNMPTGRGFIALANVAFSGWNPLLAILGALLFGSLESLALHLQAALGRIELTYPLRTIPYLGTLAALAILRQRAKMPQSLGKPYIKE